MKRLSITSRITLLFALFLVALSMILILMLFRYYDYHEQCVAEQHINKIIGKYSNQLFSRGKDFARHSDAGYYNEDIFVSVYEEDGAFFAGKIPGGIGSLPEIKAGKTQIIKDELGRLWYIRDTMIYTKDAADGLYIRGIQENTEHQRLVTVMQQFLLFVVPVLVALAVTGSWLISRRAVGPMKKLTEVINEVREEGDVSKRLPVSATNYETSELTKSINRMFDAIEDTMERERKFVTDVSHELRTPLAIISTQSEYAMEDQNYTGEALRTIKRESDHMKKLINNLLMISRSDSGRLQLEISEIDIRKLLAELTIQTSIAGADNNIKVSFTDETIDESVAAAEPETAATDSIDALIIESDEMLLMRILLNLLDNAVKYGKGPGGHIEIRLKKEGKSVVITVADDGKGIAAEDQRQIWNRFYRPEVTRSRSDSSGLGLAIVDSLTRVLGGSIRIVPDAEKHDTELPGAVFELSIPIESTEDKINS